MNSYREIAPDELVRSPFKLIGKDWLLITAKDQSKPSGANAMTASWGGLGILWNKPVATIYVRPQRYTYSLMEKNDTVSLCFLSDQYRSALRFCGTHSGRDSDKLSQSGLTTACNDTTPYIAESDLVMICKKSYFGDLEKSNFIDTSHLSHYEKDDFHRFYILEIQKILQKN